MHTLYCLQKCYYYFFLSFFYQNPQRSPEPGRGRLRREDRGREEAVSRACAQAGEVQEGEECVVSIAPEAVDEGGRGQEPKHACIMCHQEKKNIFL